MPTPREIAATILSDKKQGATLPTRLDGIVDSISHLEVECVSTEKQFEGRLELVAGTPTIFLNVRNYGLTHVRARFTLGHELGHFYLHRHMLRPGHPIHDAKLSFADDLPTIEREANEFSSELILPTAPVKNYLRGKIITLDFLDQLAKLAQASAPATAIRLADLSTASFCFYWQSDSVIQWSAPTAAWRASKHPSSAWRGKMPVGSHAAETEDSFEPREVHPGVWHSKHQSNSPLIESALRTNHGRLMLVVNPMADVLES